VAIAVARANPTLANFRPLLSSAQRVFFEKVQPAMGSDRVGAMFMTFTCSLHPDHVLQVHPVGQNPSLYTSGIARYLDPNKSCR
jgi:hypothetical protein